MTGDSGHDAIARLVDPLRSGMAEVPQDVDEVRFVFTRAGSRGTDELRPTRVPAQEGCESTQPDRPIDKTMGCTNENR